MIKLLGITLMLLWVTDKADAQTVTSWTDTLQVRIDTTIGNKPKIEAGNLVFRIQVMRPNKEWNAPENDTIMGDADLYFNFNTDAFKGKGKPTFVPAHSSISKDAPVSGPNSLWSEARYWAGRMQVALRVQNKAEATNFLTLPKGDWVTLGTVTWPCDESYATLGVVWDKPATGLMTWAGNPIIDTLKGGIIKNPDDALKILHDTLYPNPVCAGESMDFVCTAESSGTKMKHEWQDSIAPGKWITICSDNAFGVTHPRYGYKYDAKGDTLHIISVPNSLDNVWFRCIVKDESLAKNKIRISGLFQLNVRDSISAFLSKDANVLRVAGTRDSVTQCAADIKTSLRLNFYGIDENEKTTDIDTVYFTYIYWDMTGQPHPTDVSVAVANMTMTTIDTKKIFHTTTESQGFGRYEMHNVRTKFCNNAVIASQYDTLYIKEGDHTELPRFIVKVGETAIIDTNFNKWTPTAVATITGKGKAQIAGTQVKYIASDRPVADTIFYTVADRECQMTRPIDVINNQYLTLKVLLEGPYLGKDKAGKDTMRCISAATFAKYGADPNGRGFISPYNDKDILPMMPKLKGGTLCDWIYVKIRDGEKGNYVDSLSAFLRQDGVICDTAGNPYLTFSKLDSKAYYVVVKHRNHLGAMSASLVTFGVSPDKAVALDFTTDLTKIYNDAFVSLAPVKNLKENITALESNVFGLYTGNIVHGGKEAVTASDLGKITRDLKDNKVQGYHLSDIDFTSFITATDKPKVQGNSKKQVYEKF